MKKIFTVAALLLTFAFESRAQKQLIFKMKYLPERNYASNMKMTINMLMNMEGDTAMINSAKKAGQNFPVNMQMESGVKMDVRTGKKVVSNTFPVAMIIQSNAGKMTVNGKETPIPSVNQVQTLYGQCSADGKLSIDSIAGKKLDTNLKEAMLKTVNNIQATIKFPETAMKVGDTFIQEIPMDFPIPGFAAKLISKTQYKLVSITGDKANFDMSYVMTMDMSGKQINMGMSGDGKGTMVYDITLGYPVVMKNDMNVNYSMVMPQSDKVKMNGKMNMIIDQQTTINKLGN